MRFKIFFVTLWLTTALFVPRLVVAAPINTDFFPQEGILSPVSPPLVQFRFFDSRAWTEQERNIVREAIREWDNVLKKITFVETTGDDWDVSLRWAGADMFKNWVSSGPGFTNPGWNLTTPLGMWTDNLTVPWDTNTFPLKEIYFNSQYFDAGFDMINMATWYIDNDPTTDETFTGYDLLTVAKHEFGHFLGIRADWGQMASPPPGKTADEVMWGRESPGVRKHLRQSDLDELRGLGYSVPEPSTLLLLGLGLAGLGAAAWRRRGDWNRRASGHRIA